MFRKYEYMKHFIKQFFFVCALFSCGGNTKTPVSGDDEEGNPTDDSKIKELEQQKKDLEEKLKTDRYKAFILGKLTHDVEGVKTVINDLYENMQGKKEKSSPFIIDENFKGEKYEKLTEIINSLIDEKQIILGVKIHNVAPDSNGFFNNLIESGYSGKDGSRKLLKNFKVEGEDCYKFPKDTYILQDQNVGTEGQSKYQCHLYQLAKDIYLKRENEAYKISEKDSDFTNDKIDYAIVNLSDNLLSDVKISVCV